MVACQIRFFNYGFFLRLNHYTNPRQSLLQPSDINSDEEDQDITAGSQSLLDNAWSRIDAEEDLSISIPNILDLDIGGDDDEAAAQEDVLQLTLEGSENSPWIDLLEESKTSARNGNEQILSSVSHFVGILSRTGINGPRHLKASNLKTRATKIGSGSQFTVFKDKPDGFLADDGIVVKRVNVPLSFENGIGTFSQGAEYRTQLRSLELEILSLCNPVLRNHRNIVRLISWGYDYPQPDTPLPVLFMEEALMPLNDFLLQNNFEEALSQGNLSGYDIKYHLSLDIIAGVEAMHRLNIVHGDLKPENVLVFKGDHPDVPFCAKLSDFGVCIDMENSVNPLTIDDYIGTNAWLAPELRDRTLADFKPELMLRFDAYSAGLVLLSVFCQDGGLIELDIDGEDQVEVALRLLRKEEGIPTAIKRALSSSIRNLLDSNPWSRLLPNTDMLGTETVSYASWSVAILFSFTSQS
jgi:Protein kinase domain